MSFEIQRHRELTQVETKQDTSLGIMRWGIDNSFPQTLKNLIEQSPNAKSAVKRAAQFFKGGGFEGGNTVVHPSGLTLAGLVSILADDYAAFSAFAIHANYNIRGEVVSMAPLRIPELRFNEFDELQFASQIGYHPNFARNSEVRKTVVDTVTKEKIKWFDRFNPNAVMNEIQEAGVIGDYLGQVLYFSEAGHSSYPISPLQAPVNYVLADIENSILMRKETATGFINSYLLKTSMDSEDPTLIALENAIQEAQGARGTGKVITMSGLAPEDLAATVLEQIASGNGNSDIVDSVEKAHTLCHKVINGAYLIPPILAGGDQRNGFSGTELEDAYFVFNAITQGGRDVIEREVGRMLAESIFPINSISIRKLTLDRDEENVTGEGAQAKSQAEDQLADTLKNMSGKQFQQLQRISRDFIKGKLSYKQAKIQLTSAYGFTEDMVNEWLDVEVDENGEIKEITEEITQNQPGNVQ